MTNGMKSTELWVSLGAMGLAAWLASIGIAETVIWAVVSPAVGYGLSRGLAKKSGG